MTCPAHFNTIRPRSARGGPGAGSVGHAAANTRATRRSCGVMTQEGVREPCARELGPLSRQRPLMHPLE